jgi:type 1 fimbria pilin
MNVICARKSELQIALSARYVQTGAKVGVGTANARATFTLSYQ